MRQMGCDEVRKHLIGGCKRRCRMLTPFRNHVGAIEREKENSDEEEADELDQHHES